MIARRSVPMLLIGAVVLGLAGCGEIDQQAKSEKIYAGKKDTRAYEGANFGNDKKKWEAALVQRSRTQDEYVKNYAK